MVRTCITCGNFVDSGRDEIEKEDAFAVQVNNQRHVKKLLITREPQKREIKEREKVFDLKCDSKG